MNSLKKSLAVISMIIFLLTHAAWSLAQSSCSPVGYWTSTIKYALTPPTQYSGLLVGEFMIIGSDLKGTLKIQHCPNALNITVTGSGPAFHISAINPPGGNCDPGEFDVSFGSTCDDMSGTFEYVWGGNTTSGWTRNIISMSRLSTASAQVSAVPVKTQLPSGPSPGKFSFSTLSLSGTNPPTATLAGGMTATSNPLTLNFVALGPQRTPTPGGLSQLKSSYTLTYPFGNPLPGTTVTKNELNKIAAFGLSCYMVALESDYGAPPNTCASTRINGVRYSGAVTNPNGLTGTYCSAFIANVKLQGTGQLNSGTYVNYSPATGIMTAVPTVTGADGTPVIAGQTVARDRAIIPGRGVLVDIDTVGTGLLANDTGGAILGYRLDLFKGAGVAACANYSNPIAMGVCNPEQTGTCPRSALK
jgi:3D (Asp-Asp-Asp) domain-containing protein